MGKLILGDCIEEIKKFPENSIDAICCDPPYGLGFMGKEWDKYDPTVNKGSFKVGTGTHPQGYVAIDKNAFQEFCYQWAKECLRVLKPGGHLLSFGGTRTYHRMACAIEDAGFEVRDMVEWVYGCLSEDTEILTESGYKPLHKLTQYDRIGVYDITNNFYKWERPQRYSVYKVHQDTAYRIKSDYTDQIVSRNHRCLVEREGKLVFIQADELNEVEYMPTLSEDFYSLQENSSRKLLLKKLLWKGKGLAQTIFGKWTGNKKSEERIEVRKEPSLERWSNLLEETRKLQADKICEVSEGVFTDGEKRWICNGTSFDNGSILGDMFRENPSSASYQSRPTGQQTGKPDVISIKQGTQITRRARVTKIEYSGIIFCPTVSTGAFIARRNGQVFITGNSGFPKSLNIGKAVDKLQGNEREVIDNPYKNRRPNGNAWVEQIGDKPDEYTKGTSEWEGWGTTLKPSHEPICLARKPLSEKSVAENVLKWKTGGINIDESRVGTEEITTQGGDKFKGDGIYNKYATCEETTHTGRFPANLILDNSEEVRECFPESKSSNAVRKNNGKLDDKTFGKYNAVDSFGFDDSGNASRFFKTIPSEEKNCRVVINCALCGKPKSIRASTKRERNYCSLDCARKGHSKFSSQNVECAYCGTEFIKKNSQMFTDKHFCSRDCMGEWQSKFLLGENSYNWKDGKMALISRVRSLKKMIDWRNEVYKRDDYTCQKCGDNTGGNLEAHHKNHLSDLIRELNLNDITDAIESKELWDIDNGITLCDDCHIELHKTESKKSVLYFAKASKAERNRGCEELEEKKSDLNSGGIGRECSVEKRLGEDGINAPLMKNNHPTVKPIALMEYLIKMITPKGGTVLDPFMGSGSTGIACKKNGFDFIGIEKEEDYMKIAEARINNAKLQQKLI